MASPRQQFSILRSFALAPTALACLRMGTSPCGSSCRGRSCRIRKWRQTGGTAEWVGFAIRGPRILVLGDPATGDIDGQIRIVAHHLAACGPVSGSTTNCGGLDIFCHLWLYIRY